DVGASPATPADLPSRSALVADRGFPSAVLFAQLRQGGTDFSVRLRLSDWVTVDRDFCISPRKGIFQRRSYWIPGSWHLRVVYTDDLSGRDPSQESNRAGQHEESRR